MSAKQNIKGAVCTRVAYVGIGSSYDPTVMVVDEYRCPDNPGLQSGITRQFIDAPTLEEAVALAQSLKSQDKVDLVQRLR
jgi:hypothetical protein